MSTSLKELLSRQRNAALARQQASIEAVNESIPDLGPQEMFAIDTSFTARINAVREKAEADAKALALAESKAAAELRKLARLEAQEEADMISEGGFVRYEPGKALALRESSDAVIFDAVEEHEHYESDDDSAKGEYFYDDIMAGVNVKPDPSQEAAVRVLSQVQYGCLIGAAGTGKTTTTRLLLNTLINGDVNYDIPPLRLTPVNLRAYHSSTDEKGTEGEAVGDIIPSIAFCAYTGQATQVIKKNMPGNWQKNVFTIHSLLGFFPETYHDDFEDKDKMRFVPYYTKMNRMPWDVIFIDEASMVALDLWHLLLDACKLGCRIYMIGDLNQLPPPIGMGVLGFALAKWTVSELTHVHRMKREDGALVRGGPDSEGIIATAHRVLKGEELVFDDPTQDPNWRVIGMKLNHDTATAYKEIVNICAALNKKVTINGDRVYDPWRDRVMTCMNGFEENTTASLVGQHPINEALSQIFADPDEPRIIISCQTSTKKFAVGYRVMATKNEGPAEVNRVTNGLTGRITGIKENTKWFGDKRLVGDENEVRENRKHMVREAMEGGGQSASDAALEASKAFAAFDSTDWNTPGENETKERNGGPASHIVSVRFDNGALREYSMNAQVEQLMIAYASTTHKAQGAEFPTAIIIVHHAHKAMLCRENLYTAVTRASQRVIILYSEFGLRIALGKQKITGKTIKEKLKSYENMLGEGGANLGFKMVNVKLKEGE